MAQGDGSNILPGKAEFPISAYQLGLLAAHVDSCNAHIETLTTKLNDVDKAMSQGKGVLTGITLAAGTAGSIFGAGIAYIFGGGH
jgi:hypothetical protein